MWNDDTYINEKSFLKVFFFFFIEEKKKEVYEQIVVKY